MRGLFFLRTGVVVMFCYFLDCLWEWLFLLWVYLPSARLIQQIKDLGKIVHMFFFFLRALSLLIPVWPSARMVRVNATISSVEVSKLCVLTAKPLTCLWLNNSDGIISCSKKSYGCINTAPNDWFVVRLLPRKISCYMHKCIARKRFHWHCIDDLTQMPEHRGEVS